MRTAVRLLSLATLVALVFIRVGPSLAQSSEAAIGGFSVTARANGVRAYFDLPGSLPFGPLIEATAPEAQVALASGPRGSALASLAFPGPVVLGIQGIIDQAGGPSLGLPPYQLAVQASSAGPTATEDRGIPGTAMLAKAEGSKASATAILPEATIAGLVKIGALRSDAAAERTDSAVTATAETHVTAVSLLGGLIEAKSVTTVITGTSDGNEAKSDGGTTLAGLTILGLPAVVDADGVRFVDAPSSPLAPLRAVLDPLAALNPGLVSLIAGDAGGLQSALESAGLRLRLAEATARSDGGSVGRRSAGLILEFTQELGSGPLRALFDALPLLPEIPGMPLQANDIVQVIQARSIGQIAIGGADLTLSAGQRPAPFGDDRTGPTPDRSSTDGAIGTGSVELPDLNPPPRAGAQSAPSSSGSPIRLLGDGIAFPIVLGCVALALLSTFGTRRLPEWALTDGTHDCALRNQMQRGAD